MQGFTNMLFNLVLVTIPEQFFLVVMTLIFLKKFGILDVLMWKQNIKWILIPVIPISIIEDINTFIITNELFSSILTVLNLIFFYILIVYVIKNNSNEFQMKDHRKIFLSLATSFLILGVLESVTVPLMLLLLNKSLIFINSNATWNFIASIPSRIFESLILSFLIIKNNNVVKIRMFDVISKNNLLLVSTTTFVILSNIFAVYAIKLVGVNRILENKVSMFGQIVISMGILVVPALILFWVLLLINYILVKEKQIQQTYENLIRKDDVMLDVED